MNGSKFGILGGGMVAGYAAKQLVELGLRPGESKLKSGVIRGSRTLMIVHCTLDACKASRRTWSRGRAVPLTHYPPIEQ
jgi:hypothetical protein